MPLPRQVRPGVAVTAQARRSSPKALADKAAADARFNLARRRYDRARSGWRLTIGGFVFAAVAAIIGAFDLFVLDSSWTTFTWWYCGVAATGGVAVGVVGAGIVASARHMAVSD